MGLVIVVIAHTINTHFLKIMITAIMKTIILYNGWPPQLELMLILTLTIIHLPEIQYPIIIFKIKYINLIHQSGKHYSLHKF